jgi:hypothetical protein
MWQAWTRSSALPVRHLVAAALVAMLVAAVYGPLAWGLFAQSSDFRSHLTVALHLYETARPIAPHFLYHGITAVVYALLPGPSIFVAGAIVIVAAYGLTGGVTYAVYRQAFRDSRLAAPWAIAVISIVALMAQPITTVQAYSIGYLWPDPYHSPTFTMLKPFALAAFAGTAWFLTHREAGRVGLVVLFALVTLAGALTKPSFVICVLPATALMMAWRLWRRLPLSSWALIGGLYVPAGAVLAWQFLAAFSGAGGDEMYQDSVSWAPLKFMSHWATGLPAKFAASTLFPLTVAALYWPTARRDALLQLAWLCFGFGALYSYAVVETDHWAAGNFVWSGYITVFTLFMATTIFWLRQVVLSEGKWPLTRALVCGAVFALHVLSGARLAWLHLKEYAL